MLGPGKYDPLCTQARETAQARGVIMIVLDGLHGSGFSVQVEGLDITARLPEILRRLAADIEADYGSH